jgi:hypothetical protein
MVVVMPVSMVIVMSVSVAVVLVLTIVMPIIVAVLFVHFDAAKVLLPPYMLTPIGSLVSSRNRTPVTEAWIEVAIHISVKFFGTMEPRSCTNEDPSEEPLRSVVSKRSAGIWGVIKVTVWANRGHSDIDCDLGSRLLRTPQSTNTDKC